MDFEQLHTFITVANFKNFSKAAELLNVTQPTVTARINNLEQEMDCKLFHRKNRSISLTSEGEIFLSYSNEILKKLKGAQQAISLSKKPAIKLGLPLGISPLIISKSLSQIELKDFYVSIQSGKDSYQLEQLLLKNELNIALISRPIIHEELYMEKISNDQLVFVVNSNHRFAKYTEIIPDDLNGETLICHRRNTLLWLEIEQIFENVQVNYIEVQEPGLVKELISFAQGVSVLPIHFLDKNDFKKLRVIPFKQLNEIPKAIYVSYKKEFSNKKYIKPLIDSIKTQLDANLKKLKYKKQILYTENEKFNASNSL